MSTRSALLRLLAVLVLLAPLAAVVDAKRPPQTNGMTGVLDQKQRPLLWKGRMGPEDAPHGGEPVECAGVPCDHFRLKIDLPPGTFRNPNRPGGVQVALRWFGNPAGHTLPPGVPGCCGAFDTLHLFVYKDGALVAQSAGIIAVSQSAFLPEPDNGWYDI